MDPFSYLIEGSFLVVSCLKRALSGANRHEEGSTNLKSKAKSTAVVKISKTAVKVLAYPCTRETKSNFEFAGQVNIWKHALYDRIRSLKTISFASFSAIQWGSSCTLGHMKNLFQWNILWVPWKQSQSKASKRWSEIDEAMGSLPLWHLIWKSTSFSTSAWIFFTIELLLENWTQIPDVIHWLGMFGNSR